MYQFYKSDPKLVELGADVREAIVKKIKHLIRRLCCQVDLDEIEDEVQRRRELVTLIKPKGEASDEQISKKK